MTAKRIYLVKRNGSDERRLIRAANVAQARNHAARDTLQVSVASQDELVAMLTCESPMAVEDAGGDRQDEA